MKAPQASTIFRARGHLRAMVASPWPDAAARRRPVSADASAEPDSRDSRRKARTAYRRRTSRTQPRICGRSSCMSLYKQRKARLPPLGLADTSKTIYSWDCTSQISCGRKNTWCRDSSSQFSKPSRILLRSFRKAEEGEMT